MKWKTLLGIRLASLLVSMIVTSSYGQRMATPATTNPYYLTKKGEAILISGKQISGKFFYSSPPFWGDDFFIYYPTDIKSRQEIPVADVSKISIYSEKSKEYVSYMHEGKYLKRKLSDGTEERLTTSVLRNIE